MTTPPNVLPRIAQRLSPLMKQKWVRELILLWPTLTGKRFSNKAEDYGVFQPSRVERLGQLSIYVKSIARSRAWYERTAGLTHSRTCAPEPHPLKPGWTLRACYMDAQDHAECLVLLEETDPAGTISTPTAMSFFHTAFELAGNDTEHVLTFAKQRKAAGQNLNYGPARHNNEPGLGDGETGGNVACYLYDPDWNNVEFCGAMDTIENYQARYGKSKGRDRI
ncbi:MAG: VOC family protein [Paracoccus sp. (in: a-proteobacteria)]|uniref:VOC family protein n=1 Tax=Paracoccus sp. TaxID=267 RepID=UPI0026E0AFB1|nr:VOC family protein [Paracoccus sp. (in: a-proteobacteria)]MDO5633050.1 VOC family protein [Paracoccus sp. (in: a-proteobacteria)]